MRENLFPTLSRPQAEIPESAEEAAQDKLEDLMNQMSQMRDVSSTLSDSHRREKVLAAMHCAIAMVHEQCARMHILGLVCHVVAGCVACFAASRTVG